MGWFFSLPLFNSSKMSQIYLLISLRHEQNSLLLPCLLELIKSTFNLYMQTLINDVRM